MNYWYANLSTFLWPSSKAEGPGAEELCRWWCPVFGRCGHFSAWLSIYSPYDPALRSFSGSAHTDSHSDPQLRSALGSGRVHETGQRVLLLLNERETHMYCIYVYCTRIFIIVWLCFWVSVGSERKIPSVYCSILSRRTGYFVILCVTSKMHSGISRLLTNELLLCCYECRNLTLIHLWNPVFEDYINDQTLTLINSWNLLFCCWSSLKKLTASVWWLQNSPYTCFIFSAFSWENCDGHKIHTMLFLFIVINWYIRALPILIYMRQYRNL